MITEQEVKNKLTENIWSKIKFGELNECWIWGGSKTQAGYGRIGFRKNGKNIFLLAHRIVYEAIFSDFDSKLEVRHYVCGNPICCNPNHLKIGTHKNNMEDMVRMGRHWTIPHKGEENGQAKLKEEQVIVIKNRALNGEKYCDLAEEFGVSPPMISLIMRGIKWKHLGGEIVIKERRGESHSMAKLTEGDVRAIRIRIAKGESQKEIAKSFNVSHSLVNHIHTGKLWKHLTT